MQIRQLNEQNQRTANIEMNYRFLSVIFAMLCMMFFISALANGQGMDFGDAPDRKL